MISASNVPTRRFATRNERFNTRQSDGYDVADPAHARRLRLPARFRSIKLNQTVSQQRENYY
jgi:hypothetical protein